MTQSAWLRTAVVTALAVSAWGLEACEFFLTNDSTHNMVVVDPNNHLVAFLRLVQREQWER